MAIQKMAKWALFVAAAGLAAAACAGQVAEATGRDSQPTGPACAITDVSVTPEGEAVALKVESSGRMSYSLYQETDPLRLILEMPRTSLGEFTGNIPVNSGVVSFVRPSTSERGAGQLEIYLTAPGTFAVDEESRGLSVMISPGTATPGEEIAGTPAAAVTEESPAEPEAPAPVAEALAEVPPADEEPLATTSVAEAAAPGEPAAEELAAGGDTMAASEPEPAAAPAAFVTGLDVKTGESGTTATINADGEMDYEYFLVEGKSLVVDIYGTGNKIWPAVRKVDDDYLLQVRIGEHFKPKKMVRVVFDLKKPGDYKVHRGATQVKVTFGNPTETVAVKGGETATVNTVTDVYFRPFESKSRVEIRAAVEPDFKVVDSGDPLRIIVEVDNARIDPAAEKTLDLSRLNREISQVTSFQYQKVDTPAVRVVAQLRRSVPFRVNAADGVVTLDVDHTEEAETQMAAAGTGAVTSETPAVSEPVTAPAPAVVEAPAPVAAAPAAAEPAVEEAPAEEAPAEEAAAEEAAAEEPKGYTGKRLALDFKDADVNDILRLISEVSGLNFVSGPEVKGVVTIKLSDVPWDQALEIILKTNIPPLAQVRESDNIIRVTTASKLLEEARQKRKEEEERQKTIEAQKDLEPLVTKSFSISYAKVSEIEPVVNSFTSDRVEKDGLVKVDERTNTLIVRDLPENVAEITRVVIALDTPTPAVLVEARIVEVNSDFSKSLGVQWNTNYIADAAHGNATPYEFPNSIGVGGNVSQAETGVNPGNYLVNLPAANPVAGIGLAFGHIANTFSLDMKLTAMEKMGRTKILSNPKVLVVQNEEAMINVGSQLPIPKTDAEGNRTVEFKDVGILLKVTPQVTNDKQVFMDISIEKSDRGETVATTEGEMFSIDRRGADTKVLIGDGETAVIGGIFQQTNSESESGVPGLSRIPLLGWLFKTKSKTDDRAELMIFITPRIVNAS